jgi:periplasmic protein TonB
MRTLSLLVTTALLGACAQPAPQRPAPASGPVGPAITNGSSCAPTAADYPAESRRLGETGTTSVRFTIGTDGRLAKAEVVRSSGSPRLDEVARVKLSQCQFRPGRDAQGNPIGGTFQADYVWKLQ